MVDGVDLDHVFVTESAVSANRSFHSVLRVGRPDESSFDSINRNGEGLVIPAVDEEKLELQRDLVVWLKVRVGGLDGLSLNSSIRESSVSTVQLEISTF